MRNALAPLATKSGDIGRIQDIPGSRTLIVADYAPAVGAMKDIVDLLNTPQSNAPTTTPDETSHAK